MMVILILVAKVDDKLYFLICHLREQRECCAVRSKPLGVRAITLLVTKVSISLLKMAGNRIMPVALNIVLSHVCQEIIRIRNLNLE